MEKRNRSGEQLNVRIPTFARTHLRRLHADLEGKDSEKTSEPELVAALIWAADRAKAQAALRDFRPKAKREAGRRSERPGAG